MNVNNLAMALMKIPSITDTPEEAEPLRIIQKLLKRHGIPFQLIGKSPKLNLVSRIGSGEPVVVLNSHMDVVNAGPKMFLPFIADGKLHGRGAADAKGPLAAMICTFLHFAEIQLPGKLILNCVCDEENAGKYGSSVLAKERIPKASYIFGEPTDMKVIAAEKGFIRLKISVKGKEAHAAFPDKGDNAIIHMAKIISNLSHLSFPEIHPMLSPASVSIGTIRGGNKINIVAGWCALEIDIRYLPSQKKVNIINALHQIIGPHGTIEEIASGNPYEASLLSPLVQAACHATQTHPMGVSYATDARFFSSSDAIVLGPGAPNAAHTDDEYISIAQLNNAVEIYKQIIRTVLSC